MYFREGCIFLRCCFTASQKNTVGMQGSALHPEKKSWQSEGDNALHLDYSCFSI